MVMARMVSETEGDVVVYRFRTTFVRDMGLSFRYYSEGGQLEHAVWSHGGEVESWSHGDRVKERDLDGALLGLRGVTNGTSWLVPSMLYGRPDDNCSPRLVRGTDLGCLRCVRAVFAEERRGTQLSMLIDTEGSFVRRVQKLAVLRGTPADNTTMYELHVLYEAEFDVQEEPSAQELRTAPWQSEEVSSELARPH